MKSLLNPALKREPSLFQRILLTTDGTVTSLISLFAGEPIQVCKLEQRIVTGGAPGLDVSPTTRLLKRTVLLRGKHLAYLYAESFFVLELLSKSLQEQLLTTDKPIGILWREERMEMYREMLGWTRTPCEDLATYFSVPADTPFYSRSYATFSKGKRFGIITEKFPNLYFQGEPS